MQAPRGCVHDGAGTVYARACILYILVLSTLRFSNM